MNVIAQICSPAMPHEIKWTIRLVNVLVLPVPAPATINKGEIGDLAALCCSGFNCGMLEFISTIVRKMKSSYKPLIVAVFLGMSGFASGGFFSHKAGLAEVRGALGTSSSPSPLIVGVARGANMADSPVLSLNAAASITGARAAADNPSHSIDLASAGTI